MKHHLDQDNSSACLIWDAKLGLPDAKLVEVFLTQKHDVWHSGLKLGLSGKPDLIDCVNPTWMLNRDPDPNLEATSWRLSLQACLIRTEVLRQLGGPDPAFESLEGAGLELGFRYIRAGAFVRHAPQLLPSRFEPPDIEIPMIDQLRFIHLGFGKKWTGWAILRGLLTKKVDLFSARRYIQKPKENDYQSHKAIYSRSLPVPAGIPAAKVSVLIPTINRYLYLKTLLGQLSLQTIPPHEIIVVDQTPQPERDAQLPLEFADLPIRWIYLDQAGQCSSRNEGLRQTTGDYVLLLDDDEELFPELIESHIDNINSLGCSISCGTVIEPGQKELPYDFRFMRISPVFPGGNTMFKKEVLIRSGLFDLAYDHGQRADHDLGMRLYLAGELMILDPSICLLHHHAPKGGLREHKARVSTYAKSRNSLTHFNLLTVSDIYLSKRYFTHSQVHELFLIDLLGTFSLHGSIWRKALKAIIALISLPKNIGILKKRSRTADQWLLNNPQIPSFELVGNS